MDDFILINNSINTFIKNKVQEGNIKGAVLGVSWE